MKKIVQKSKEILPVFIIGFALMKIFLVITRIIKNNYSAQTAVGNVINLIVVLALCVLLVVMWQNKNKKIFYFTLSLFVFAAFYLSAVQIGTSFTDVFTNNVYSILSRILSLLIDLVFIAAFTLYVLEYFDKSIGRSESVGEISFITTLLLLLVDFIVVFVFVCMGDVSWIVLFDVISKAFLYFFMLLGMNCFISENKRPIQYIGQSDTKESN